MAHILEDGLRACIDCAVAIANGDLSGLDDSKYKAVIEGLERLATRGYAVIGGDLGFCHQGCDCCLTGLAGTKYELSILGD